MKSIIVANWKMNPQTYRDAKKLFDATRKISERQNNISLIVAPPALYLRELAAGYKGRKISFAGQSAHFEAAGSYTGELSMAQLRDAKATHVLIGHAERRAMGETDAEVRLKVTAALQAKLTPIVCIGEKSRNNSGEHFTFVASQLLEALADVPAAKLASILIAYEPVWAIGAERPMDARSMHEMAIFIRKKLVERFGVQAMKIKILYGGSIDQDNAADMLLHGDVNGLLIGRASTEAVKFTLLLEAVGQL
ncbi:MAG TPA: triose-phosphate isomerase [Candidatus Paceibacterota bacterium]|nr:triose-phosphate isomerase [Candidatus Paceibacterota bacterium]